MRYHPRTHAEDEQHGDAAEAQHGVPQLGFVDVLQDVSAELQEVVAASLEAQQRGDLARACSDTSGREEAIQYWRGYEVEQETWTYGAKVIIIIKYYWTVGRVILIEFDVDQGRI